jgi:hypothetical protein
MPLVLPQSIIAFTISGDVAGLTCYTKSRHRVVAFPAAPPSVPPTDNQRAMRLRFGNAMRAWHALDDPGRQAYRDYAYASKIPMLGHNIWISLCLTHRNDLWKTLCRQSQLPLPFPIPC